MRFPSDARSASAFPQQDHFHSLQQDQDVENEVTILHVEEIELKLLGGIALIGTVREAQLRPDCDAGLDRVPLARERNGAIER
jgi:hypothetical protein